MKQATVNELTMLGLLSMVTIFIIAIYEPVLATAPSSDFETFIRIALNSALTMSVILTVTHVAVVMHVEGFMPPLALMSLLLVPHYEKTIGAGRGVIGRFVLRCVTSAMLIWASFALATKRGRYWPRYDDAIDILVSVSEEEAINGK